MNNGVKLLFHTLLHPTDGFNDCREKSERGFLLSFAVVWALFIVRIAQRQLTGFYFNNSRKENMNIFFIFIQTVLVFILWVACNWAVATLNDGKARVSEIWFFSGVALVPYVCAVVVNIAISNFLLPNEVMFMTIINMAGIFWSLLILFCGIYVYHDYSVWQIVKNIVFTVLFMLVIIFVAVIIISLFRQIFNFGDAVIREIITR